MSIKSELKDFQDKTLRSSRSLGAELVDWIINYMRIPNKPGQLKPVGLEDINELAEYLFNKIYDRAGLT